MRPFLGRDFGGAEMTSLGERDHDRHRHSVMPAGRGANCSRRAFFASPSQAARLALGLPCLSRLLLGLPVRCLGFHACPTANSQRAPPASRSGSSDASPCLPLNPALVLLRFACGHPQLSGGASWPRPETPAAAPSCRSSARPLRPTVGLTSRPPVRA